MRVISWNLKNIGQGKLGVTFPPAVQAQVGNNVLDYMVRVVLGRPPWAGLVGGAADIFIVIELKTGGHNKNTAVTNNCTQTLISIVNQLNIGATNAGILANYRYSFVVPVVSGYHETVGVIFNNRVFNNNPAQGQALRDNNNLYVNPRTPMLASLTETATNEVINVIGIHAPPPSGADRFQPPIRYCLRLPNVDDVDQLNNMQMTTMVMGDFNCDKASTFNAMAGPTGGFNTLVNTLQYNTEMLNNTLTSLRKSISGGQYLSGAYDNVFSYFNNRPMMLAGSALDLIGQAPNVIGLQARFNAYWRVSDHIPVMLTW